MDDEPRYTDDPFDQLADHTWREIRTAHYPNIVQRIFSICSYGKRRYFASRYERRKWDRITRMLDDGEITLPWVENCIQWAVRMNDSKVAINVNSLLSFIENTERYTDWSVKNEEKQRNDDEYDDVPTTPYRSQLP